MQGPSFDLDLKGRTLRLCGVGEAVEIALPADAFDVETSIERVVLRGDEGVLRVSLPGRTTAVVELRAGEESAETLRRGRPLVYLDQNQWSKVAAWRGGDRKLLSGEAAAAETLARLVERQQVLLPASAGHFVETGPMYGQPRVGLASTVLALSRGWQMRNPLHVRIEELARGLAGGLPAASGVFAPGVDALFSAPTRDAATSGLPAAFGEISGEITNVLGLYEAVVDSEAIEDEGGAAAAAATRWADAHAEVAERLHADGASRQLVWRVVHARLLLDLTDDIARAGGSLELEPGEAIERLTNDRDPLAHMPFLARVRHWLFARVRNFGQRWEENDLIDVLFLGCAAGYADIVIGERSAIGYLRQCRNVPAGARLATTLAEGVELLIADGSLREPAVPSALRTGA